MYFDPASVIFNLYKSSDAAFCTPILNCQARPVSTKDNFLGTSSAFILLEPFVAMNPCRHLPPVYRHTVDCSQPESTPFLDIRSSTPSLLIQRYLSQNSSSFFQTFF